MIAHHGNPFKFYGMRICVCYSVSAVIDDFGNVIRLRLSVNGMPTLQSYAIRAFLRGPLH